MVGHEGGGSVGLGEGRRARRQRDPGVVVRPARPPEIPAVLALWREADAVPSVSDDPASLHRLLATSEDALRLVAEAERRLTQKCAIRFSALVMSAHDPAVALWRATGYDPDPRVGRFVRSLR